MLLDVSIQHLFHSVISSKCANSIRIEACYPCTKTFTLCEHMFLPWINRKRKRPDAQSRQTSSFRNLSLCSRRLRVSRWFDWSLNQFACLIRAEGFKCVYAVANDLNISTYKSFALSVKRGWVIFMQMQTAIGHAA